MEEDIINEDGKDYLLAFPGVSLTMPQLCTASDGRPCHILDQLPACNKILRCIPAGIHEGTPYVLTLSSWQSFSQNSEAPLVQRKACALIFWLLKRHRCLGAIEIGVHTTLQAPQKLILQCLRTAPSLRNLKIHVNSLSAKEVLSSMSCLGRLEVLEVALDYCPQVVPVLSTLLETLTTLTTLKLELDYFNVSYGLELWAALASCISLNSLQVHFLCGFDPPKQDYSPFLEYLQKTRTLKSVDIALDALIPSKWLISVLEALNGKQHLHNVILENFFVDIQEEITIEKFLTGTSGIRSFKLRRCFWRRGDVYFPAYDTDDMHTLTPRIRPWLSILEQNCGLHELRLKFHGFTPAECAAFLEELSRNRHLRNVHIEDLQEYCCSLYSRRHRDNNGRTEDMPRVPEVLLNECLQIRHIRSYVWTPEHLAWFAAAMLPVELSNRVTELDLRTSELDLTQDAAMAIAEFIAESKTLARFAVNFRSWNTDAKTVLMLETQKTILKAIHRNSSIKDLYLCYPDCTGVDAEELAWTIRKSRKMCYLDVCLGPNAGQTFLSHLVPSIWCNYTVVRAFMTAIPDMGKSLYDHILNVAARNQRLVLRAAKFVLGSPSTGSAEAMEFVASNPALVYKLGDLTSVDEAKAFTMIREKLRELQDIDSFMRIAGVVKRRVKCHKTRNSVLQLDDVDQYTWRSLRKYLRLADVYK